MVPHMCSKIETENSKLKSALTLKVDALHAVLSKCWISHLHTINWPAWRTLIKPNLIPSGGEIFKTPALLFWNKIWPKVALKMHFIFRLKMCISFSDWKLVFFFLVDFRIPETTTHQLKRILCITEKKVSQGNTKLTFFTCLACLWVRWLGSSLAMIDWKFHLMPYDGFGTKMKSYSSITL